jgi:uncharacterized protein (TIGR02145 family)
VDVNEDNVPAFTIYNGDISELSSYDSYGYLYNHNAANDPRNICPQGWHVPSVQEWDELATYLGGADVAGGIMTKGFLSPPYEVGVWGGQYSCCPYGNESGFSAYPTGKVAEDLFSSWNYHPLQGQYYYGLDIDDSSYFLGYDNVPPYYRGYHVYWNNNNMINTAYKPSAWWWSSSVSEWGELMKVVINIDSPELLFQPSDNTGICIRCLMD